MANVKISELAVNSSPSASATLAGVDGGQTVQIPISYFQNLIEGRMPYYRVYSNTPATLLSAVTDVIWNAIGKESSTRILLEIYGYHKTLLVINAREANGICSIEATNLYTGEQLQANNIDPTTTTISSFLNNYVVNEKIVYHYSDINTPMVDFANYVISQGYIEGQDALAKIKDKMYIFNISASWAGGTLRRYTFLDLVDLKKFYSKGSRGDKLFAQLWGGDASDFTITSVFDELTDHEGRIKALEESVDDIPDSIPYISFGCYSPEFTVADLMNELPSEVMISGQPAIVSFMGMLSGTFLCRFSEYHSGYYGCKFTDLTNLKTYYFEGESRSLSLYDNLSGESSGEASMPRIRLSNWEYTVPATYNQDENGYGFYEGEIKFSVCVQDGSVQEGDQLEICALKKTFGKYKLRQFSNKTITAEDIENLDKQPFLQFSTGNMKAIHRTDSGSPQKAKPKFIRIRRPVLGINKYGDEVEVSAHFSNVVPVHIGLSYEDITGY